ncbi:MAG: acyl carrier protein [Mariniphaga sp.]|jgi:acyl carrier protein|nr:acyl carrier protein [Mariniphaga sp.]
MEKGEVKQRIKKVVSQVLKIDKSEIADNANFIFDLGADSMQSMLLIAAFEEEFDIEMDVEKAQEVQTIDGAVDFISNYLQG